MDKPLKKEGWKEGGKGEEEKGEGEAEEEEEAEDKVAVAAAVLGQRQKKAGLAYDVVVVFSEYAWSPRLDPQHHTNCTGGTCL